MVQVKKKKADPSHPFQKRKQKVGKKKLLPVGATKAEIHSSTIFLKKQTKEGREGEITNNRNMTFADCAVKLHHYSASTRKEGVLLIHGLVKMSIDGQPAIPVGQHATLLQSTLPLLTDPDAEVRKAVVALTRVTFTLFETTNTLQTLLPLIIRFITVPLTHMEQSVRFSACKSLQYLCSLPGTCPLPESDKLLDCTYRMLKSCTRPKDGSQPPVLQAYLSLLRASLLTECSGSEVSLKFDFLSSQKGNGEGCQSPFSNFHSTNNYFMESASMVISHWVESVHDTKKYTKVAGWEIGLLEVLNTLIAAASLSDKSLRSQSSSVMNRMVLLPKSFKQLLISKLVDCFPFEGGSSDVHRVNAQLALLLTSFLPEFSNEIRTWLKKFLTNKASHLLRPVDIQAVCVTIERIARFGGNARNVTHQTAEESSDEEMEEQQEEEVQQQQQQQQQVQFDEELSLSSLITTGPGSPLLLEVVRSIHRLTEESIKTTSKFPSSVISLLPSVPRMIYGLAIKLSQVSNSTSNFNVSATIVPTVTGSIIQPSHQSIGTALSTAYELLMILILSASAGCLPREMGDELTPSLFGVKLESEVCLFVDMSLNWCECPIILKK
eukprot:TRINITY_DN1874_c2_g1_i2.p1 TRINITY_DN1874_c2_g1~~TRINITY_DN1874_c2_g1_i2.p1  ORF type:complete len:608 (+),score=131.38 TRINITY_DN1874_c2_g1_i2:62-1885(+)